MNIKDITDKNPDITDLNEFKFLIEHFLLKKLRKLL